MSNEHNTDVCIIGAGPVGLFAVFECGMMKMRAHVVDTLEVAGGQCTALYPEKPIYDIAGYPSVMAGELVDKLEQQAAPFEPVYHMGQQVVKLDGSVGSWTVTTSKDTIIHCKAVLIAAGCGAFGPNRPPLEGLASYEATGSVAYMVQKREAYRDKKVVIAGGGDSALDWAISLSEIAASVELVHRRPKFRAAPDSVDKLNQLAEQGRLELVIPYQLSRLEGGNGQLSHVVVADLDGNERALEADHLLAFYGLAMELGPIAEWGLNLHMNHITVHPTTLQTSTEGIYAIGDICAYEHKLKLIACGFSEAAMAAHHMYSLVHPDTPYHFEYSTTSGVPA